MLDAAAPAHATAVTAATPAAELDTDADEALRLSRQIAQQLLHVSDLLHAHSAAELRARVPGREMVTAIKQARQVVQRELRSTAALLSELEAVLANCPAHSRDHDRIRATVDRHKAEMNRLQGTARQATRAWHALVNEHNEQQRAELMRTGAKDVREKLAQLRGTPVGEQLVNMSDDINATLRRTRAGMTEELQRMNTVSEVLARSQSVMVQTIKQHKEYGGMVKEADSILAKRRRRQMMDKLLIGAGLALFALVVIYIIGKRTVALLSVLRPLSSVLSLAFPW